MTACPIIAVGSTECVLLTVCQYKGLHVELVAGPQTRFGEELVHGHYQVSLSHMTHSVQNLLKRRGKNEHLSKDISSKTFLAGPLDDDDVPDQALFL